MMDKKASRKHFRLKRQKITITDRFKASNQALQWLLASEIFQKSDAVSVYMAKNDEFDCAPIIQSIWQHGKKCYLPVLDEQTINRLRFALYRKGERLQPNHYGILEPINREWLAAERLDLVLLPLLGFDQMGNRLGTGGGYYDRTFQFLNHTQKRPCYLMGVGFSEQYIEQLSRDPWDIQLDAVLTEKGLMTFKSHAGS